MKVFLTGGSGFVGSHVLRRLLEEGHEVRALIHHHGTLTGDSDSGNQLAKLTGDIISQNLASQVAGCDAVINLVGIIHQRGKATFEALHHQGTRNLVYAAKKAGVKRFLQMSALGARAIDATVYHTTKFAAEEEVRQSGISYVILRPSVIFGPGSAFVQQMVRIMRTVPFIRPIPGTGKYKLRPIHVDDVAECFAQSLTNPNAMNQTIDLVGGEELTLDEIGEQIAHCLGVRKAVLHVRMPLMMLAATLLELLPIPPPVNRVQLRMLTEGSTGDPSEMKRIFHLEPIGFRAALREYLSPDSSVQRSPVRP